MSATRERAAGLTLIEVMLALAILGIGLVGLIGAAGRALSVVAVSRNYAAARDLYERTALEHPIAFKDGEPDGDAAGAFEAPFEGWRWSREIERFFENKEEPLFRVRTRIHWSDRGREAYEEFTELILAPDAAPAAGEPR